MEQRRLIRRGTASPANLSDTTKRMGAGVAVLCALVAVFSAVLGLPDAVKDVAIGVSLLGAFTSLVDLFKAIIEFGKELLHAGTVEREIALEDKKIARAQIESDTATKLLAAEELKNASGLRVPTTEVADARCPQDPL